LRILIALSLACCVSACNGSGSSDSSPQDEKTSSSEQADITPTIFGSPLKPASPRVIPLPAAPNTDAIPLDASLAAWHGKDSHIAGSAHYDRGEWIYEDYPWTAYGAAQADLVVINALLDALGGVIDSAQRLPGGLGFVIA